MAVAVRIRPRRMAQDLDIPRDRLPRHVAIIMDGNGRWAVQRGMDRVRGHQQGATTVRAIVTECAHLRKHHGGPDFLTLYSFSLENWKRPIEEVSALMQMYIDYLRQELPTMLENNIRFRRIGRSDNLPPAALEETQRAIDATAANTGLTLVLAMNYGSRLDPSAIDERTIAGRLYTAGMPDPDLLIRTAGEMRVSNYLLWQISYAELVVSPVLWPDFTVADLHDALRQFARRSRRFGALDSDIGAEDSRSA